MTCLDWFDYHRLTAGSHSLVKDLSSIASCSLPSSLGYSRWTSQVHQVKWWLFQTGSMKSVDDVRCNTKTLVLSPSLRNFHRRSISSHQTVIARRSRCFRLTTHHLQCQLQVGFSQTESKVAATLDLAFSLEQETAARMNMIYGSSDGLKTSSLITNNQNSKPLGNNETNKMPSYDYHSRHCVSLTTTVKACCDAEHRKANSNFSPINELHLCVVEMTLTTWISRNWFYYQPGNDWNEFIDLRNFDVPRKQRLSPSQK